MGESSSFRIGSRKVWLSFNSLRLIGLGAIVCAFAIEVVALQKHSKGTTISDKIPSQTISSSVANTRSSTSTSTAGASTVTTAQGSWVMATPDTGDSIDLGAFLTATSTQLITVTDSDIALALYPTATGTERPKRRNEVPITSRIAEEPLVNESHTTGPNMAAGIFNLMALMFLLLAQLGTPEDFFIQYLCAFSSISGPGWLGLGKVWLGVHSLPLIPDIMAKASGWCLIGSGLIDLLIAFMLFIAYRQSRHKQIPLDRDPYLVYAASSRTFVRKPLSELVIFKIMMNRTISTRTYLPNEEEFVLSDTKPIKGPSDDDYPTFSGKSLGDRGSQIPGVTRSGLSTIEEDVESRSFMDATSTNAPTLSGVTVPSSRLSIPTDTASATLNVPGPFQTMFEGIKPRFSTVTHHAHPGMPSINLMPSTPSTIGVRSVRFPRPETAYSTSTSGSGMSTVSDLNKDISNSFPNPPTHPPPPPSHIAQTVSKSRKQQINLDQNKLMPPRKSSVRRVAGGQACTLTPPQQPPSIPLPTIVKKVSADTDDKQSSSNNEMRRTKSRSVRFDLKRDSASSVESNLDDFLPPRDKHNHIAVDGGGHHRASSDPFDDGNSDEVAFIEPHTLTQSQTQFRTLAKATQSNPMGYRRL